MDPRADRPHGGHQAGRRGGTGKGAGRGVRHDGIYPGSCQRHDRQQYTPGKPNARSTTLAESRLASKTEQDRCTGLKYFVDVSVSNGLKVKVKVKISDL